MDVPDAPHRATNGQHRARNMATNRTVSPLSELMMIDETMHQTDEETKKKKKSKALRTLIRV